MLDARYANDPWIRVTPREPCPICGHTRYCEVTQEMVLCMWTESPRPARGGGWLHPRPDVGAPVAPVRRPATVPRQGIERRHKAYDALLKALPLTPEHLEHLTGPKRGFALEELRRLGYASLPDTESARQRAVAAMRQAIGDVRGIPGIYGDDLGDEIVRTPGILLPSRSAVGRVQAIQVRRDGENISPRYVWFSSGTRDGGTSCGAPAHLAGREHDRDVLWITEGVLKADIAAKFLRARVVGLGGVNMWRQVPGLLKSLRPRHVVLAYDMDLKDNPHVMVAFTRLVAEVRETLPQAGLWQATWAKAKGIDDALLGDEEIAIRRVPEPAVEGGDRNADDAQCAAVPAAGHTSLPVPKRVAAPGPRPRDRGDHSGPTGVPAGGVRRTDDRRGAGAARVGTL